MNKTISNIVYETPYQDDAFELILRVRVNGVIAESIIASGSLRDVPTPERIAQLKLHTAAFNTALGLDDDAQS
jgi:hypothetical protein